MCSVVLSHFYYLWACADLRNTKTKSVIPTLVLKANRPTHSLAHWKLKWRSHKLGVSKASSTNPIACLRERSGGWHYSTTALQPEATAVPERESHEKIPWKIRLREKEDNTRKLTLCVWSTVSLTSSWMSPDQVVETMLISVTWLDVLNFSLFLPNFCPQLRAGQCLRRICVLLCGWSP